VEGSPEVAKRALRRRLRAARAPWRDDPAAAAAEGAALRDVVLADPRVAAARTVAAYAAVPGEPQTAPLLRALLAAGTTVLLPRLLDGGVLDWVELPAAPPGADPLAVLRGGRGPGGPEPPGPGLGVDALAGVDVVLVPALAVDTGGRRLGQGLGCYDRALRAAVSAPAVALVHDAEVLDAASEAVPAEPWDRPVDAVATAARWLDLPLPGHR
jgi:5-formyltetrahydrofolate cyclo-ligase